MNDTAAGPGYRIVDVQDDGLMVVLDDGSCWSMNPDDCTLARSWRPGTRIAVTRSGDKAFPVRLTNLDGAAADSILVARAG